MFLGSRVITPHWISLHTAHALFVCSNLWRNLVPALMCIHTLSPGRPDGALLTQQSTTCISQWEEVLQGAGKAIQRIKTLTLNLTHKVLGSSNAQSRNILGRPKRTAGCSPAYAKIVQDVCARIALAVPDLKDLRLQGLCQTATFDAFGSSCSQLTHLEVDATTLPVKALNDVYRCLTNLACLTLKTPRTPTSDIGLLGGFVGAAFCAVSGSTTLSKIVLDFQSNVALSFEHSGNETYVPANLRELVCLCDVRNLANLPALLGGLRFLTMDTVNAFFPLDAILNAAPHLQNLSLSGSRRLLLHGDMLPAISLMKQRMLQGLTLEVDGVWLHDTSSIASQSILAAFPILPSVHTFTLFFRESQTVGFLTHVASVFPNLTQLHLEDLHQVVDTRLGVAELACLGSCAFLKSLRIQTRLSLSTEELAELCKSIPSLTHLGYLRCGQLPITQLRAMILSHGQVIAVKAYPRIN